MKRGALVVIEGLDGVGKTTQKTLVVDALNAAGMPAMALSMPDRSLPTGKRIDQYLRREIELTDHEIHELYADNRAELISTVIEPALAAGTHVICDRYSYSGVAYTAAKGRADLTPRRAAVADAETPLPDALIYLHTDGRRDLDEREELDRYEGADFQARVAVVMHQLVAATEDASAAGAAVSVCRVARAGPPEATCAQIIECLQPVFASERSNQPSRFAQLMPWLPDQPVGNP